LAEFVQKAGEGDFLRAVAEAVLQILMEADVGGLVGAARHERAPDRVNYRHGYRDRSLDTRLGSFSGASRSSARAATSRRSWSPGR
jgi:putative transposase